ncbi:MAG: hypothetical protein HQL26_11045, partial [Candidatus Omnitrophica bacterium]|nr:hypothetical protein [Candidatus Omnitrophota bacterium]
MRLSLRSEKWFLIIILAAGFFVHSFMLGSNFKTVDDLLSVASNESIRSLSNIPQFFHQPFFQNSNDYYRPLVSVSFALDYWAHGLVPFYYNLTNLLLHVLCGFLVYFIIKNIVNDNTIAFLSGLL